MLKISVPLASGVALLMLVASSSSTSIVDPTASPCYQFLRKPMVQHMIAEALTSEAGPQDVRPESGDNSPTQPTKVVVDFFLTHIVDIESVNGQLEAQLIFRQQWNDSRLQFRNLVISRFPEHCTEQDAQIIDNAVVQVPISMQKAIWVPDLYVTEELSGKLHDMLSQDNQLMRVRGDGLLKLSQRLTVKLACPDFSKKMSMKECSMSLESYGHTADEIEVDWKEDNPIFYLPDTFVPRRYQLTAIEPTRCDTQTSQGVYSCIRANFHFSK